jgi:hypothetical protein
MPQLFKPNSEEDNSRFHGYAAAVIIRLKTKPGMFLEPKAPNKRNTRSGRTKGDG